VSRLRASPAIRVTHLEEKADDRELQEGARSPVERAWERAMALAPAEEVEELKLLCELAQTQKPESLALLELCLKVWALKERMMHREAPTLAVEYRLWRDLLLSGLDSVADECQRDYEEWCPRDYSTPEEAASALTQLFSQARLMRQLVLDRRHVLRARDIAEPISDIEEARQVLMAILEAVDRGDRQAALDIVNGERGRGDVRRPALPGG
jgi:hypothetical protein